MTVVMPLQFAQEKEHVEMMEVVYVYRDGKELTAVFVKNYVMTLLII